MFGFIYLGITAICSFIDSIKAVHHDLNAVVDPKTNTYIDYHGIERDARTTAIRVWTRDKNGHEVLLDKNRNIVRNITIENRKQKADEILSNNSEQMAFDTLKNKSIYPKHGIPCPARIYVDTKTLDEYAVVLLTVPYERTKEEKEFYVKITDPETLICISDDQRDREKQRKKYAKYNWIDYPNDEKNFINHYNSLPIGYDSERIPILRYKR